MVCELQVENTYFGPNVNVLREEAKVTDKAGIWASQSLKEKHHWNNLLPA